MAYQVIGDLPENGELLDHPNVQRALDYLAKNRYREDFSPFLIGSR